MSLCCVVDPASVCVGLSVIVVTSLPGQLQLDQLVLGVKVGTVELLHKWIL